MPSTETHALPPMMTVQDVAGFLGVSMHTANRIIREEGCPFFQSARTRRIPRDLFLEWFEKRTTPQKREQP